MKNVVLVLMAAVAMMLMLTGCSDESALPVSPKDHAAQGVAPLAKNIVRPFTATEDPDLLNPLGYVIDPGSSPPHNKNKMIVRGMVVRNVVTAAFSDEGLDVISGHGVLEMNFTFDNSTMEGTCWGKLTLDPDAVDEGVWEMTWNGTITVNALGFFECPMKLVGHGKGGAIDGMQFFSDDQVMTIWSPFDGWAGQGTGFIKAH